MTTEERIERTEKNLHRLAVVQDEMMDLLGLTVEGERRLATRMQQIEELHREHQQKHEQRMDEIDVTLVKIGHMHAEIDEKLNALIGIVDGFIRGKG
jgi:hypothetical protein